MLHSSWDMETYARTHQEDRMREAAKARQLEAAGLGWKMVPSALTQRIRQAVSSTQARFSTRRSVPTVRPATVPQPSVQMTPVAATQDAYRGPRVKPVRAAEPYAAMVVVARSAAAPVSER